MGTSILRPRGDTVFTATGGGHADFQRPSHQDSSHTSERVSFSRETCLLFQVQMRRIERDRRFFCPERGFSFATDSCVLRCWHLTSSSRPTARFRVQGGLRFFALFPFAVLFSSSLAAAPSLSHEMSSFVNGISMRFRGTHSRGVLLITPAVCPPLTASMRFSFPFVIHLFEEPRCPAAFEERSFSYQRRRRYRAENSSLRRSSVPTATLCLARTLHFSGFLPSLVAS